jgi:DNA ligase-1
VIDDRNMTLAVDMTGDRSVVGWLASEKLNGCRAFWDGRQFWTRGGLVVDAPKWFTRGLPRIQLDGEIHAGRGHGVGNANSAYKVAMTAVRHGGHWFDAAADGEPIRFTTFDAPQVGGNWLARVTEAGRAWGDVVKVTAMRDIQHFVKYLTTLRRLNAEGAMFRDPHAVGYDCGRSDHLLRFKYAA